MRACLLGSLFALFAGTFACSKPTATFGGAGGGSSGSHGTSTSSSASATGGGMPMGPCQQPSDCGKDTTCAKLTCSANRCGAKSAAPGTPCSENNGKVCNGKGSCVQCNASSDCPAATPACSNGACVPGSCADGIKDNQETDVDCGGPVCAPCANGKDCLASTDCQSQVCKGKGGAGGAGGAGGMGAPVCAPCGSDADCQKVGKDYCNAMGACAAQATLGAACAADHECLTGHCADKVCCDQKCASTCAACAKALTGMPDGSCGAVTKGTDPHMECGMSMPSSCGASGKGCSGTVGSCILYDSMTQCLAPSCDKVKNQQASGANCDGMGNCGKTMVTGCAPYTCGATACLTDCKADGQKDCIAADYCDGQSCQPCASTPAPTGMAANCPAACTGGCPVDGICKVDCANNTCANVVCPDSYNCFVSCGNGHCQNATINCPSALFCDVSCSGNGSCMNATIKSNGTSRAAISCSADTAVCDGAQLTCGVNSCEASCAGMSKPQLTCGNSCSCTGC